MNTESTLTLDLKGADNNDLERAKHGYGVLVAAVFIAANVAGSGVLALPKAASDAGGWLGVGIMIILCVNAAFSSMHLGLCWGLLEKHYPDLRGPVRNPYPTIGDRAFGTWARRVVVVALQAELLGAGTVFLLLSSQNIDTLLKDTVSGMTPCLWLLVLAALLCPAMWLGSPKDFWGIGVAAMLTTMVACTIATVQSVNDSWVVDPPDTSVILSVKSFFLGFGVILFAFGGASTFPTIQNDMRDRSGFPKSVTIAFAVILCMYIPVTVSGFAVFGHDVDSNILESLTPGPAVTTALILVTLHLVTTVILMTNPATQYLEILFKVPPRFCWQRCLVRTGTLLFMVFLGATIQDFGKILALVGGSTSTLLNLVFPPVLFLKLKAQLEPQLVVPLEQKIYLFVILVMGVVGGVAATYFALLDIFSPDSFRKPCYIP